MNRGFTYHAREKRKSNALHESVDFLLPAKRSSGEKFFSFRELMQMNEKKMQEGRRVAREEMMS